MPKFYHEFTFGFALVSSTKDASDVTGAMLRVAINELPDDVLWEVCGAPHTTHEDYTIEENDDA